MFDAIIAFSLRHRPFILVATIVLVVAGVAAFYNLPIDAVPDITNNQVQVLTSAPSLSAAEVERYVTVPIEGTLKPLPDVVELRSLSQSGLSVVTVVFPDNMDIYVARNRILEKLHEAVEEMPEGVERPELAPVSTGLGEVFRYVVRDTTGRLSSMDLRTVQDWIIRRGLLGTAGLAEVNSLGGQVKQYHVLVRPEGLAEYGLTLRDVFDAVSRTSGNAGGAYIETGPEQLAVRAVGLATGVDDLQNTVIRTTGTGIPILLSNVASVQIGPAIRFGSASQDGKGEVVTGITMQLKGANSRIVVDAVKDRIDEIKEALPEGVVIEPYYDREALVENTIGTVVRNLVEGALLVIGILLLFLVNLRAGLVVASIIPLSMLFAGIMMMLTKQSGNLMSLGAVDFGLVVDGSLIIVENCLRLLEERLRETGERRLGREEARSLVLGGSIEVRKAAQFGELVIIIVYLPILTLQGIEGKLFRPMAMTVAFALIGALILSITYVPALLSLVMKRSGTIWHSPVIEWIRRLYEPALRRALNLPLPIVGGALLLLAGTVIGFTRLGGEFIPKLDEGDIAMHLIRLPSVSLTESQAITTRVERTLMKFPEVRTVVSSTGRAEISTDPMGFELADIFLMLHPRDEWMTERTKEELIQEIGEELEKVPGIGVQFLQPIEMRMNELIAGARGDVAIKVTGTEYGVMNDAAERIASILRATPGSADVTTERASGLPQLVIRPDRSAIARYGMTVGDINQIVSTAIAGTKATEVMEGEYRFDVVVRLAGEMRRSVDAVRSMIVATPTGARIPLSDLADVSVREGPTSISREGGTRFVTVQANVRGRDVKSFVEDARRRISGEVRLPAGYNIMYGGQFRNLEEASRRLSIVVPIALVLIFLLLFQTFRSVSMGLMIFLCVPMSVIGGVAALMIRGLPFSISAGVGFIALFGIAVLNGIVMVAAIRKHRDDGLGIREAVLAGAFERLRPVLTTAALAAFGFIPMMLSRGAGAEVQRPLATVIFGGVISSTLLTLFLLPILYEWMEKRRKAKEERKTTRHGGQPKGESGGTGPTLMIVALCMLAATTAASQTPLTREEARRRGIAAAPELRGVDARIEGLRGERRAIGVLSPLEIFGGVDESSSPALTGRANARLGFTQTFPFPGTSAALVRRTDALMEEVSADRDVMTREIHRRVDAIWLDAIATRHLLERANDAVAVADSFARLAARRRELGETPALETLQASLAVSHNRTDRARRQIEYRSAMERLRAVVGAKKDETLIVTDSLAYEPLTLTPAEMEERALKNDPRLRAADHAITAARIAVDVASSRNLPDITIGWSLQTVDGIGGFFGGEARLSLPLWQWINSGADQTAQANVVGAQTERERIEREVIAELRDRHARHAAAYGLAIDIRNHLLPQAIEAYDVALRLFLEGEVGYMEVLAAQSTMLDARTALIEAMWNAAGLRLELLIRVE